MRKVILFNMVSADGFFAGPNGEIDWHNVDDEFNAFAVEQLQTAGGFIFGRKTYEGMASYWPTPAGVADDPVIADKMNALPKYVFSTSLEKAVWNNTTLVKENAVEELAKIKEVPGDDLYVFGSADLAATFTKFGVIDEYRIMVNPVVLGSGEPLFKDVKDRMKLNLIGTRTFHNGNVLLVYQLVRE